MSYEPRPGWPELLERQAGVVTRGQALSHGMTGSTVRRELGSMRWRACHNGVYATFTGPLSREAALWAAVLRAGPGAALSHQTAADLLGLADGPGPLIHVTVPSVRHPEAIQCAGAAS